VSPLAPCDHHVRPLTTTSSSRFKRADCDADDTKLQEQWVLRRLTLNGGVRFDYIRAYIPEQEIAAVQFVGPRSTTRIDNLFFHSDRLAVPHTLAARSQSTLARRACRSRSLRMTMRPTRWVSPEADTSCSTPSRSSR
jgi:hypothetical protein